MVEPSYAKATELLAHRWQQLWELR